MIDINVTKFPIVIVANFRTGSTALGQYLSNKYKLPFFSEPFHNENIGLFDDHKKKYMALTLNSINNQFVVKFMPSQISDFNNYEDIFYNDGFKIRLNRNDKVDQIVSLYIAEKRDKFFKLKNEFKEKYEIPVDINHMYVVAKVIIRNDFLLKVLPCKYDIDLIYEDLGTIENTDHVLTDQPDNIEELREKIRAILKLQWSSLKEHLVQSERFELSTHTTSR